MTAAVDTATPLAEKLRAAVAAQDGNGNGATNGSAEHRRAHIQTRRVATKVGRGMLAAANQESAEHSDDVVVISAGICDLLALEGAERHDLLAAARLHDIGKAAVPKEILDKPGPLTEAEWKVMRSHTEVGADILSSVADLRGIAAIVRHSHERLDGGGYPDGLAGEEIPLGSRIIFCADAFHAIRSDRPYRAGRSARAALVEVAKHSGTQFDPDVVEALHAVARELRLAPSPRRRVRRSSRLSALLLMLALGGGGSAVAHSGLLGDPGAATPGAAPVGAAHQAPSRECPALGCFGFDALLPPGSAGKGVLAAQDLTAPGEPAPAGVEHSIGDRGRPGDSHGGPLGHGSDTAPGNSAGNPHGGPPGLSRDGAPGNSEANPHGGPPGPSGNGLPPQSGGGPPADLGGGHGPPGVGGPGNAAANPHGGAPGHAN